MRSSYDTTAPRRTVSLTINSDLVARARAAKINLSAVSEAAVAAALRARLTEALRVEGEMMDRHVAEHGSFTDAVMACCCG